MSASTRSMGRRWATGSLIVVAALGVAACGGGSEAPEGAPADGSAEVQPDPTAADAAPVKDRTAIRECLEAENFEVNAGTTPDDLAETFQISAEFKLFAPSGGYGSVTVYETTEAADDQFRIQQEISNAEGGVGQVGTSVYDWWGDESEAAIVQECLA